MFSIPAHGLRLACSLLPQFNTRACVALWAKPMSNLNSESLKKAGALNRACFARQSSTLPRRLSRLSFSFNPHHLCRARPHFYAPYLRYTFVLFPPSPNMMKSVATAIVLACVAPAIMAQQLMVNSLLVSDFLITKCKPHRPLISPRLSQERRCHLS